MEKLALALVGLKRRYQFVSARWGTYRRLAEIYGARRARLFGEKYACPAAAYGSMFQNAHIYYLLMEVLGLALPGNMVLSLSRDERH